MSLTIITRDEVLDKADRITHVIEQDVNSPLTFAAYNEAIGDFIDFTVQLQADDPFSNPYEAFVAFKDHLRDLKPSTANKKLSAIRRFYKVAAAAGYVTFAQYDAVEHTENVPNESAPFRSWLTEDEARQLLDATDFNTEMGRRDQLVILMLLVLAMRRTEVTKVTWGQLVRQGDYWLLINVKTKREKLNHIKIPDKYVYMFLEYRDRGADDEPILSAYTPQGERKQGGISDKSVYLIVEKYGKQLGFDIHPHMLRRSGATIAHQNGASTEKVRQLLGHSDERTTRIYLQNSLYLDDNATDYIL